MTEPPGSTVTGCCELSCSMNNILTNTLTLGVIGENSSIVDGHPTSWCSLSTVYYFLLYLSVSVGLTTFEHATYCYSVAGPGNCFLSSRFSTLPLALRGITSTNTAPLGTLKRASLP